MKANTPMAVTNVKLLLEALTCEVDGLSAGLKALATAPGRFPRVELVDGPRRLQITSSGVCGAFWAGSVYVVDPVFEFAQDGDALWWFDHTAGGLPVQGSLRERVLVLERAIMAAFSVDSIRAYRAVRLLAGMHSIPVPGLS